MHKVPYFGSVYINENCDQMKLKVLDYTFWKKSVIGKVCCEEQSLESFPFKIIEISVILFYR